MVSTLEAKEGSWLLINKDLHWTSFDVVAKIRNTLKIKKVGHAGTLDPLASGLLLIATGKKTKEISHFMGQSKTYIANVRFGATTPSLDAEFPEEQIIPDYILDTNQLESNLLKFRGEIDQVPPIFSAIHIQGKRAYHLARVGNEVIMPTRKVTIYELRILSTGLQSAELHVKCSSGTYIRSLARDIGEILGVPAYLSSLRRTHIGDFDIKDAYTVKQWIDYWKDSADM